MLKKLFECGCFDYRKFILSNTKPLSISTDEAAILIKLLDDYEPDMPTDNSRFKDYTFTKARLDKALTNLFNRGFFDLYLKEVNGKQQECVSLDKLFTKIELVLTNKPVDSASEVYSVSQYLEKEMNRFLTSKEIEIVTSLVVEDRYNQKAFENAVSKLKNNKRLITIKTIVEALSDKSEAIEINDSPKLLKSFFDSIK